MRILKTTPYLTDDELKKELNSQKKVDSFRDYQIIYCVQTNVGKKAEEIAKMLGVTKNKIFKTVEKYNKKGLEWKSNKSRGGRGEVRCVMSIQEEALFLSGIEQQALKGQMITYKQIKDKLQLAIQTTVSDDYIWDLLKRHDWRKKFHVSLIPKRMRKNRKSIKKLPELLASKSLKFRNQEDTRPIKLFFQDEARFGRIDRVCSCWVPKGGRALAGNQIVREYTYTKPLSKYPI